MNISKFNPHFDIHPKCGFHQIYILPESLSSSVAPNLRQETKTIAP
jgi:hypothetical protein